MELKKLLAAMMVVAAGLLAGAGAASAQAKVERLPEAQVGEDGLHIQPWFHQGFLDLREDLAEAQAMGKDLALIWEQRGCPYCRETHRVSFRIPEIVNYIKDNFVVIQLNLWGDREMTDFGGETMSEKAFARKYGVQFTPTIMFLKGDAKDLAKKHPRDREVWRLMGYWKPFHFKNSFVYAKTDGYKTEPNFQRWLQILGDEMRARGEEVNLW